jgi:hypothetical protein
MQETRRPRRVRYRIPSIESFVSSGRLLLIWRDFSDRLDYSIRTWYTRVCMRLTNDPLEQITTVKREKTNNRQQETKTQHMVPKTSDLQQSNAWPCETCPAGSSHHNLEARAGAASRNSAAPLAAFFPLSKAPSMNPRHPSAQSALAKKTAPCDP